MATTHLACGQRQHLARVVPQPHHLSRGDGVVVSLEVGQEPRPGDMRQEMLYGGCGVWQCGVWCVVVCGVSQCMVVYNDIQCHSVYCLVPHGECQWRRHTHSPLQVEGDVLQYVEGPPPVVQCLLEACDVCPAAAHVFGARHLGHQHVPAAHHCSVQPQVPVHALHRHRFRFKGVSSGAQPPARHRCMSSATLTSFKGAHWRTISSATRRRTIQP